MCRVYFTPHPDISIALIEEVAKRFASFISVTEAGGDIIVAFGTEEDAEEYICATDGDERFLTPA